MKAIATIAVIGLLNFVSAQNSTWTQVNTLKARQCVECQYWGGNWCPNSTSSTPAVTNGNCDGTLTTCSTGTLAKTPGMCTQITGHATKNLCNSPLWMYGGNNTLQAGMVLPPVPYSFSLQGNSYCELDLTITNGTANMVVGYSFSTAGTAVVALISPDTTFQGGYLNQTQPWAGSIGVGSKAGGLNSSVSILFWNQSPNTTVFNAIATNFTIDLTSSAMLLQVASVIIAAFGVLAF
jgi:hypothetical protein